MAKTIHQQELDTGRLYYPTQEITNAVVLFTQPKKDRPNEPRFLLDCRPRNLVTEPDYTPLPNIGEFIELVSSCFFWSKIDLRDGFHNVAVAKESEIHNAIMTLLGPLISRIMQQGDRNAPATMVKLMHYIFSDMVYKCVVIYLDDIFICNRTYEEHVESVQEVCRRLLKEKFYLKESKCQFLTKRLEILGQVLTPEGLSADPITRQKIMDHPAPSNRRQLRGFMGIVNYLCKFLANLGSIAAPLTELQGEGKPRTWTETHNTAFKNIQQMCNSEQLLKPWDITSKDPVYLVCDASDVGLGSWIG